MRVKLTGLLTVAIVLSVAAPAFAQQQGTSGKFERYGGYRDRFFIQVGGYFPGHETIVRLDSELTGGSTIRLEQDLALPDNTTDFRIEGYIRFGKRHRMRLGYVNMQRDVRHRLEGEIVWGGETYPVGVEAIGQWDTDVFKAEYRFSVINKERVDVGLSLGVFAMSVTSGIGAPEFGLSTVTTQKNAPLPMGGLDVEYFPIEKLLVRVGGQLFGVKIGEVDGKWFDARLSAEYYPLRNLGFGVGYNWSRVDVDAGINEGLLTQFAYGYRFNGPQVFLIGVF